MKTYTLYKSNSSNKKYDVYVENPNTGRINKVSFGAYGYSDYTKHKDVERRERYRLRHKNDKITDITKPGMWSWWILWNKLTIKDSMNDTLRRFKLKPALF